MRTTLIGAFGLTLATTPACAHRMKTIALLQEAGAPWTVTPRPEIPLEVVTRSTAIPDPLPVEGAPVSYADVEHSLAHAVGSATVPWAEAHRHQRPEGWQLFVELVQADAEFSDQRLKITMSVRATLRTRYGNVYLAQTHAHCQQAGLVEPERGASVIYSCMARMSRDLAGWLGGVEP
ncbi:MAG: hypothetical protein HY898_01215 [Deltaproteobacteria bacterium]|nr:hypothetical protein [Deltaproteobacteria bacterium]